MATIATPVANEFFRLVQNEKFDSTKFLFTDFFLSEVNGDSFVSYLEQKAHWLGRIQKYTLEQNNFVVSHKEGVEKHEFIQTYKVEYENRRLSKYDFIFLEEDIKGGHPKIGEFHTDVYTPSE
ncbi:MAG: hypothetical protein EOP56_03245 [Sphingobacteriales bacterium]|nr:MAG: hypothetical protein EOP56_03245 [Sphingobacteriales bacterium]